MSRVVVMIMALPKYPPTVNASILCMGPYDLLREYFTGITIGNLTQLREEWLVNATPCHKLLMHLFIEEHRGYLRGDVKASIDTLSVTVESQGGRAKAFEAKPFTSRIPQFAACGCNASLQRKFISSVAERPKCAVAALEGYGRLAPHRSVKVCRSRRHFILDVSRSFFVDDDLQIIYQAMEQLPSCIYLYISWCRLFESVGSEEHKGEAALTYPCFESNEGLHVNIIGLVHIECVHTLFDVLTLGELKRVIWLHASWVFQQPDDDSPRPTWHIMVESHPTGLEAAAEAVEDAHVKFYKLDRYQYVGMWHRHTMDPPVESLTRPHYILYN
jgi:hypothetical protein